MNLENEREFRRVLGEINGREAVMRKRKIRKCGLERERKEQSSDILTVLGNGTKMTVDC